MKRGAETTEIWKGDNLRFSKSWNPRQNILLIDDIYTTGSTIERAAGILKKAGVKNVYFLTLSIGQGI